MHRKHFRLAAFFRTTAAKLSLICIAVGVCAGCRNQDRYFRTEASAVEHFRNNKSTFDEAVARWRKLGYPESFSLDFSDGGGFSWNSSVFKPDGQLYDLAAGNGVAASRLTLDQAAAKVGIGPEDLRWWLQTARELQVHRIATMGSGPPLQERYVQMYLRGSGTYGYGFLYAPTNDPRGLRCTIADQLRVSSGPYLWCKDVVADDWLYFEETGSSGGSVEGHPHPEDEGEER